MSTTLLAVDDSATMRKVLEITFSGEEFRVVTADSPDAALKKARSERPGLILVDVTLPGQDGYALCKTFKAEMPNVPVVILSSKQGPYDAAKGSAAGADEYADKPFDTQQIIDKVKRVLLAKSSGASAPAAAPPAAPAAAQRPGAGTLPGSAPTAATPPPVPAQPANRPPQTQAFGSSGSPARSTQPGAAPPPATAAAASPRTAAPTLGVQPAAAPAAAAGATDTRTRTASGLGSAAAQAQAQTQGQSGVGKPTQPALPAQLRADRPNTTPFSSPSPAAGIPAVQAPAGDNGAPAAASPVATAIDGQLSGKLAEIGLSPAQVDAVLALSREVVERVVWEVVPVLAETLIKEEIKRLTTEG